MDAEELINRGLGESCRSGKGRKELRDKIGGDWHVGDKSGSSYGWQGKAAKKDCRVRFWLASGQFLPSP